MTVTVIGEFVSGNGVKLIKAEFTPNASGGTNVNVPGLEVGDFVISTSRNNGSGRYIAVDDGFFDSNVQTAGYLHQNSGDTVDYVVFLIRS